MRLNNLFINLTIYLAIAFGIFTLYIWTGLFAKWDYNLLLSAMWAPAVLVGFIIIYLANSPINWSLMSFELIEVRQVSIVNRKKLSIPGLVLLGISIIVIAVGIDESFLFPWILLASGFILIFISSVQKETSENEVRAEIIPENKNSLIELISLFVFGVILVVLYLFSSIGNADDTHFVSYIAGLIQYPDTLLFSTDTIFNNGGKNVIFVLNYGQSWEALSAVISSMTGLSHLTIYYLYLPVIFLFFTPVPLYYFTKLYFPKHALISVFFALLILICWSTYNHLQGMFFIPRFYQGKAILLSFFLPLLILSTRRFLLHPDIKTGIATSLLLISSAGSSSTGLYISIIVVGICYLSYTPLKWKSVIQRAALVLLIILPNLVMLSVVKANIDKVKESRLIQSQVLVNNEAAKSYETDSVTTIYHRPIQSMYWLFGDHRYLAIFILMFSVTFLVLTINNQFPLDELRRFYLVLALLAFNHPLASFLTDAMGPGNLIWRFHWVIPMSIIFSLFSASLLTLASNLSQEKIVPTALKSFPRWILQIALVASVFFVAILFLTKSFGHLSGSFESSPKSYKTNADALLLAESIVQYEKPSDKILAANQIAELLPMLMRNSQLVTSRPLYWHHPYFSSQELLLRKRLQYLINNVGSWRDQDLEFVNIEIKKRDITTLIFEQNVQSKAAVYNNDFSSFDCSEYKNKWVVCKKVDDFSVR